MATTDRPLAKALRAARAASGLSVRALAARAGLSRGHVSDLQRGRRQPSAAALARLAAALPESEALREAAATAGVVDDETLRWLRATPGAAALVAALRASDADAALLAELTVRAREGVTS